jgi:hypothetical protein
MRYKTIDFDQSHQSSGKIMIFRPDKDRRDQETRKKYGMDYK